MTPEPLTEKRNHADDLSLPPGFKMTELGPLPEEWQVVRLGEVADARGGVAFSSKYQGQKQGKYPFYKVSDMNLPSNEIYMNQANNWIDDDVVQLIQVKPFLSGTIIFPKVGGAIYTNKKRLLTQISFIDNNLMGVTILEGKPITSEYLFYWLDTIDLRDLSNPGPLPSINAKRVKDALIPLPPLPEQKAIAHVLRTVQGAKEAAARVIQAARELKKSLMRHLFTYGPVPLDQVHRVPLRETDLGPLPAHWQVVRLGEVVDVKGGKRLPKGQNFSDCPTSYPYLRVSDFREHSINKNSLKYLTREQHNLLRNYVIKKEDIYISIAGTIGLVGVVPEELDGAHLTENAARLIIKTKDVSKTFLVYILASEVGQNQIHVLATKTSQPKLALARIREIQIPLPPLPEQQAIARILQAVDRKIAAEEARQQALEALFKTLLHHLMTGQVRVVPPTAEAAE